MKAVFQFDCNGSLLHEDSGLMAIGWGDEVAMGALEATPDLEPEERILRALSIAAKRTCKVAPPFHIESWNREFERKNSVSGSNG